MVSGNMNNGNTMLLFFATTRGDIVARQLLCYDESEFWDMQQRLMAGSYRDGVVKDPAWRAEGSLSNIVDRGHTPGGAMVYNRPAIHSCPLLLLEDINKYNNLRNFYEVARGHSAGIIVNGWVKSTFNIFSIYLDCQAMNKPINRAVLMMVGLIITLNMLLYVIMGDWQFTPEQLSALG